MYAKATLPLAALVLLFGCATVVRGGHETLHILSEPAGAEVLLSTGHYCVTPCSLEVKRKGDILVTFRKAGYRELNTAVISSIDGKSTALGTTANLLTLPIINDVVDYRVGANYSHKPNPLSVVLVPEQPPPESAPEG